MPQAVLAETVSMPSAVAKSLALMFTSVIIGGVFFLVHKARRQHRYHLVPDIESGHLDEVAPADNTGLFTKDMFWKCWQKNTASFSTRASAAA